MATKDRILFFSLIPFQHRRMHVKQQAKPAWLADAAWGHGGLKASLIASLASSIRLDFILQPAPPRAPARGRNWRNKKRWNFQRSPEQSELKAQDLRDHVLCVTLLVTVCVTRSQGHPFSES